MKILNLYAGIGGNRKLWSDEHEITAVEYNPEIAAIYQDFFPNDTVIVGDAHQYLLEHYKEFDFIWSSPPCPSHSRIRFNTGVSSGQCEAIYPEMSLYQEIIFLEYYFDGMWVVENVNPYYKPLIQPTIDLSRHLFWSNFYIIGKEFEKEKPIEDQTGTNGRYGFNLSGIKINHRKDQILRNLVDPELGKHILDCCIKNLKEQMEINL